MRLGGAEQIAIAGSAEIKVDRGAWHEWSRAEADGDVVVVERTEPADNEKAVFFWNLNGVILAAQRAAPEGPTWLLSLRGLALDAWVTLNLFVIFHGLDNIPVLVNFAKILARFGLGDEMDARLLALDWACSHLVLAVVSGLGRLLGIHPVRREFTPDEYFRAWQSRKTKPA